MNEEKEKLVEQIEKGTFWLEGEFYKADSEYLMDYHFKKIKKEILLLANRDLGELRKGIFRSDTISTYEVVIILHLLKSKRKEILDFTLEFMEKIPNWAQMAIGLSLLKYYSERKEIIEKVEKIVTEFLESEEYGLYIEFPERRRGFFAVYCEMDIEFGEKICKEIIERNSKINKKNSVVDELLNSIIPAIKTAKKKREIDPKRFFTYVDLNENSNEEAPWYKYLIGEEDIEYINGKKYRFVEGDYYRVCSACKGNMTTSDDEEIISCGHCGFEID